MELIAYAQSIMSKRWVVACVTFLLMCIWGTCAGQTAMRAVYKKYENRSKVGGELLELYEDYTFYYKSGFKSGTTTSRGNWRLVGDTLKLFNYYKPWRILRVEEYKVDSGLLKTWVHVVVADGVTDEPVDTRTGKTLQTEGVRSFVVWAADYCESMVQTGQDGIAILEGIHHKKLQFEHDEYYVQDSNCNYFQVLLSGYPIIVSPPTLVHSRWYVKPDGGIIPIGCE